MTFSIKVKLRRGLSELINLIPGQRHEFFTDIKMDGLACALIYVDVLSQAVTRGDSFVGEDVTNNVRTIKTYHFVCVERRVLRIFCMVGQRFAAKLSC